MQIGLICLVVCLFRVAWSQVQVSLADSAITVKEGSYFNVRINIVGSSPTPFNIIVEIENDIDGDFVGTTQVANVAARSTGGTIVVFSAKADGIPEDDEIFYFYLYVLDPDILVTPTRRLLVTIQANDNAFGVFSIDQVSPLITNEYSYTAVTRIKILRTVSYYRTVSIYFMLNSSSNNAVVQGDVAPASGTVKFQPGQKEGFIEIQIIADDIPEAPESFFVIITSASVEPSGPQSVLVNSTALELIIAANDAPIRFSNSEYNVEEGPGDVTYNLSVTRGILEGGSSIGPTDEVAVVQYVFQNGTAILGADFIGSSGVLTYGPGETVKTISFVIIDDNIPENQESFYIRLSINKGDAVFYPENSNLATISIIPNDNPSGTLSFKPGADGGVPILQVNEDSYTTVQFVVQRLGGAFGTISTDWNIERDSGGLVPVTDDVGPKSGTLVFIEGQNQSLIALTIVQDNDPEPSEMFILKLYSSLGVPNFQGIPMARLVIEDSDNYYGTVEFGPSYDHRLFTNQSGRLLQLSLTRSGGRFQDLYANITVSYSDGSQKITDDTFAQSTRRITMPNGEDPVKVSFLLNPSTFLVVGGEFKASIIEIGLNSASRYGAFNSPRIGTRKQTSIMVSSLEANGETGFFNVTNQIVDEPTSGVLQVGLLVSREGLSGRAVVGWSLSGKDITSDDVSTLQGTVILESGTSSAVLNIGINADDIPELDENIIVKLDSIEPNDTQRLRPGLTTVTITVKANDNPGGIFQFSQSKMNLSYSLHEGVEAVSVVVERLGGDLQETSVQYSIEPNGTSEFFGATNMLVFRPGVREMSSTILAKKDGIPELDETFSLFLTLVGNAQAVISNRSQILITILENENPYGVIQFFQDPTMLYTEEGQTGEQLNLTIPVQRDYGTFNRVTVAWSITPSTQTDLTPSSGTLVFEPGQSIQYIVLNVVNDDIPESAETFAVRLSSPSNKAVAGIPMVATVVILENDNPVEFTQPLIYVSEPQTITLTVTRQGKIDKEARAHYRTLDGSASSVEKDFSQISVTELVFAANQRERTVQVVILDDDIPEQNETFYIQLFDVSGDLILTKSSTATLVILANDDAYGIFNFSQQPDVQIEEGSTFYYDVVRNRGSFESVRVYWEMRSMSDVLLQLGQDFNITSGQLDFSAQENKKLLAITPAADGIPEPAEQFLLTLTRVEVLSGVTSGGLASLGKSGLVVAVKVAASDDPNGRMAFASTSRELTVAEDFYPGNEASTRATYTVERRQGTQNLVKVLWEIFSDQLGSNIPTTYDLLFSGQWPSGMSPVTSQQRLGTATPVAFFNSGSGNYITVGADDEPPLSTLSADFSVSAWIQPMANTNGYIVARCTNDGATHYYSLKLVLSGTSTTLQFRMSTKAQSNLFLSADSSNIIADNTWHHILVAVLSNYVNFYLDGKRIGSMPIVDSPELKGAGILLIGSRPPGTEMFTGYMQDVRIMMRGFEDGSVKELYSMTAARDVTPISGVLTYNTGERNQNFTVSSIQDIEEEGREVFVILLIDTTGEATLSTTDGRTTLTVLKSDYANGLFSLTDCSPPRKLYENSTITCTIQRSKGDDGTVTVSWMVNQNPGPNLVQANNDFDKSSGTVVFLPGERTKTFSINVTDDNLPELDESFQVSLLSAVSDDGLVGSTNTSGAVLDSTSLTMQISIAENDFPNGSLQFSGQLGVIPLPDVLISPTTALIQVSVKEDGGLVPLVVLRAQGTTGTVRADWRTKDITALSEGKSPPDFVGGVGSIVMGPGVNFAWVNITVIDNTIPEAAKVFEVELYSPTGGAALSSGSNKVEVTIQASDGAFGTFQLNDSYLNINVTEDGDDGYNIAKIQVNRLYGAIGISKVAWAVQENLTDGIDIINQNGTLTFQPDQRSGFIELQVKGDTIAELDELVMVTLTQVLGGDLGDPLRTTARLTILANDDTYGRFVIMSSFRPIRVMESVQDVNITVQRLGGLFGSVQVDFVSLDPTERYSYLPSTATRADLSDFVSNQGILSFGPGQEFAQFKIRIMDDQLPEEDESVFVRLTACRLIQAAQLNAISNSPRLGQSSETYGQIIILANDDANGRLQLSPSNISMDESAGKIPVSVVRTGGTFGEVSVILRVIDGTAVSNQDFTVLSSIIILPPGVTSRLVDILIIDDPIPEAAEFFTIELQDSASGGAVLGDQKTTLVTILPSDDPNGVFDFVSQGQIVQELDQPYVVNITVLRRGGSMDTATVTWEAKLNGLPASDDISPIAGSISYVTNEVIRSISITVLPDNIPEGDEDIVITLSGVTNGARVGDQKNYTLIIAANDSPHGTVQLSSSAFIIAEDPADGTQSAQVVRSGGSYGAVRVYYSTAAMSVLELNTVTGGTVLRLFSSPLAGMPPTQSGTVVNVSLSIDTLNACATSCVQETTCLSFMYQQTSVTCLWYTATFSMGSLQQGVSANYYEKDLSKFAQLQLNRAKAGEDFTAVTRLSIVLQDGQSSGSIQLPVVNDNVPEMDEQFFLTLDEAELVNGSPDVNDLPLLGTLRRASVIISANDNAFGMFVVVNPAETGNRVVQVQETNQLAVDLVVERQGGTYGNVSVEWSISTINRTATYGEDYRADGATLLFLDGQTRRVITITILDDQIPEESEELTVVIDNPSGGATVSNMNSIKVVILANDNVAGVLSFEKSSVLVNEGVVLQIKVKRTLPAHGTVTAQWLIQAKNGLVVGLGFSQSRGVLTFLPFETEKILNLTVLADSTPKEDREYTLGLQNVTTDGVAPTGWATVDSQLGAVLITIAGSNDPHGVFQLSASSLDMRVQENVGTARLIVDRKFGAIGSVNVLYEAVQGSLKPLGAQRNLALAGQDFIGVSPGFIVIGNGDTSGYINVTIVDDDIPEIDEVFIVRLIGVSLINSTKTTLLPRLAGNGTESEVTIAANDGAQGIFQFATDSQVVTVTEQGQKIALTVVRGNGTFGQVTLFVYSQPVTLSTIFGADYNMSTGELVFLEGETRKLIDITVIDDNEPEPDETFEVILANPSSGALLGQALRARVTILANDVPGGMISFTNSEPLRMREATANDVSFSKAEILLSRGVGTYGTVSVPFYITTSDGQITNDVTPRNGTIIFSDRQSSAVLMLEAINDDEPELAETLTLTLLAPTNGALLGNITTKVINMEQSDSPFGLLQIYPTNTRLSSIATEEVFTSLRLDIERSLGTLGKITVNVVTVPGSATTTPNSTRVVLAPVTEVLGAAVSDWHQVGVGGTDYIIMLTSLPEDTQLSSYITNGSSLGAGQSVLYRWQGQMTHVSTFPSNGATAATSFEISNMTYLVVANGGREGKRQVSTNVYSLSGQGKLQLIQSLSTSGASDVEYLKANTRHFLFVTNALDDISKSDISSYLYEWDMSSSQFNSAPKQIMGTLYARAVSSFIISGQTYIAVANYYDRNIGSYEISSTVYRLDTSFNLIQHQRIPTQGAVSLTYLEVSGFSFLVIANYRQNIISSPQDSVIYRWDFVALQFVLHQIIPTTRALKVASVVSTDGSVFLVFANELGNSEIFIWDVQSSTFKSVWKGSTYLNLKPITIKQPDLPNLVMLASSEIARESRPTLFQLAQLANTSDFVPRQVTMTFDPGQTLLRTSVVTLLDDIPEDTESFTVSLVTATGGAELGENSTVKIDILANDDAYGVIEFSPDSLALTAEEIEGKDTPVSLVVLRRRGFSGYVSVAWQATGSQSGVGDLTPLSGQVDFASGQSVATITLTVRDDQEPELDEITFITLTQILNAGTTVLNKGAKLGDNIVAKLTVLANDSPYGVIAWEKSLVTVQEPDKTDAAIQLGVVREQGLNLTIRVYYVTSIASQLNPLEQATPGEDFIVSQGYVELVNGTSRGVVSIIIKPDDLPEGPETFLVNLTSVSLLATSQFIAGGPSIAIGRNVIQVVIAENDDAQGLVDFNVRTNNEGRIDVYEEYGKNVTIQLLLRRQIGFFGSLTVTWQTDPREADLQDYTPASGTVQFNDQQRNASIFITVIDDTIPENLETFDVKLIGITGNAQLGAVRQIRVGILKNDSPAGLFRLAQQQVVTHESISSTDPNGQANLTVQRVQGTQGSVNVQWRLNAEASADFMPPLENVILFAQGESQKTIVLQTRPDNILEGREEFTVSLVAVDNNADISNSAGDCKVVILPDPGASGTITILPESRWILVGEPGESSPSYTGVAGVKLTRGLGIFGEVTITWSLTPRDLSAFLQVEGSLTFSDLQQTATVVLQTLDDSVPEVSQTYTLQITSANNGATISPAESVATVLFAASDYPNGLVQFTFPEMIVLSEDQGTVQIPVTRTKGLIGELQVAYSTMSGTALSDQDFRPSAGVLTFQSGVNAQLVEVYIIPDNVPEGPEDFYINLTAIQLVNDNNNYTVFNGLSRDMRPALGTLVTKIVRIDKNDNAEGILQFDKSNYQVKEESLLAKVTVIRTGGTYGQVGTSFRTLAGSATEGLDYAMVTGKVTLNDGVTNTTINITIIDDSIMEPAEDFKVILYDVTGGALLNSPANATVTILKSDYPNGRFALSGPASVSLPNPPSTIKQVLTVERTGGALGQQQVFWHIMGPNNPAMLLDDTSDISSTVNNQEVTRGSLTWLDGELGPKQVSLDIKGYTTWEVEKSFVVELYKVSGSPADVGDGEVDETQGQVLLKVEKFGDPSGIIRYTDAATVAREVLEPQGSVPDTLVFPVTRRNDAGVLGNIQIYWELKGNGPGSLDVVPNQGTLLLQDGKRDGVIALQILPDDIPELTEYFTLVLTRVEGGATIDSQYNQSTFSIRYNDNPHGVIGLIPENQAITVNAADLSRQIKLNFTRFQGTFGSVIITYTINYDLVGSDVSLSLKSGTVTFLNGSSEATATVTIIGTGFLKLGTTFSVTLTDVQFLGSGVTEPPSITVDMSKTQIVVPKIAANSELSFSSDIAFINEADQTLTVTIVRAGAYGDLNVDWRAGYPPADQPANVTNGEISPAFGNVAMSHGQELVNITVQVSPKVNKTEAFVLRLPQSPQTLVSGGARLAASPLLVRAEPSGLVRIASDSLFAQTSELEGVVSLTLLRLYGSEGLVAVYYQTVSGSALASLDFEPITAGVVSFNPYQTVASIQIKINQDNIPEETETFSLNLTGIEKFPTPLQPVQSPRISRIYSLSQVSIRESNDPYGVLSLKPIISNVNEAFTTVSLTVSRTGGLFGSVGVTVRTVGGGETWTSQIVASSDSPTNDTIADVIGKRGSRETATGGMDYEILNTVVQFQPQESEKTVKVTILEDNIPEPQESILVYLTLPTGGARVANGTIDDNWQKGYAIINIASSDLSNGLIGFGESSQSVRVNEDSSPTLVLKLTRLNAFYGVVKVSWKAKRSVNSTDQEDADLSSQLVSVAGSTTCPAEKSECDLIVNLINDDIPEESYSFIVLLTGVDTDAQLNPNSLVASVVIEPSDYVRGLVQFSLNSREVIVGENDVTVKLSVEKVKGQKYNVTVAYNTEQMPASVRVYGVQVFPALDREDFRGQSNTLTFLANTQDSQYISISLTPVTASGNPLPKQLFVSLLSPSNGASINPNASKAVVRIVKTTDVAIWTVVSKPGDDNFANNDAIISVVGQLNDLAQTDMTVENIILIEDVLSKINQQGNQRKLPIEVLTAVRNLFCKLLDDAINDARRGRSSLATLLEGFAYILIKESSCPPLFTSDMTSTQCAAVKIAAGRWLPSQLAGFSFSIQTKDTFTIPSPLPEIETSVDGTSDQCIDFHLLDYNSATWFNTADNDNSLINKKVVGFGVKGRQSGTIQSPVKFRIHTPDKRIAARDAECVYFDESTKKWVNPNDICQVKNDLSQAVDDFVDCECSHMSSYAVSASTRDASIVGYTVWFYIICFICMASVLMAVISHCVCFRMTTFSASIHMHFLMAVFFFQFCFVLDAFLSPDQILAYNTSMDNSRCIAMGLFIHFFFLAQFTWIVTQAINLWKVLIMNDEHTDRHYVIFFIIGWGVPLVILAIFYATTFNIFKYHTNLPVDFIYGDVNNNGEICFITNGYAAIGGILAPVLFTFLMAGIVFLKAHQLSAQWQSYDDLFYGRLNATEIPLLLLTWGAMAMTCLWLALHMIYGYLWMMVLFCIFNLTLALLVFVFYAVIRNPILSCIFGPSTSSYSVSGDQPDNMIIDDEKTFARTPVASSVKGSRASLLLNDAWENGTSVSRNRMTVRRALPSQVYINPPVAIISPAATIDSDSPDFDELIYALKTGRAPSEYSRSFDDDTSELSFILDKYETKRIDIADTHV